MKKKRTIDVNLILSTLSAENDEELCSTLLKEILEHCTPMEVESLIRQYQDCDDEALRKRMHQLASIWNRRRAMATLRQDCDSSQKMIWDIAMKINVALDPKVSFPLLEDMVETIVGEEPGTIGNIAEFQGAVQQIGLSVERTNEIFPSLYLVFDTLVNLVGGELAVGVVAKRLAEKSNYYLSLGTVSSGKVALADNQGKLTIPGDNWEIEDRLVDDFVPFNKREFALEMVGQLMVSSYTEQNISAYLDARKMLNSLL